MAKIKELFLTFRGIIEKSNLNHYASSTKETRTYLHGGQPQPQLFEVCGQFHVG